jgi:hypothetical protein
VAGIKSSFALRQVKYSTALPLPGRNQRDAVRTHPPATIVPPMPETHAQLRQLPHRTGRAKA